MTNLLTAIFPFWFVSKTQKRASGGVAKKDNFWRINNFFMWFWLFASVFLTFTLIRFVKNQIAKNKAQQAQLTKEDNYLQNQNPVIAQNKADKITTRKDIQAAALSLAHNLGTMYSDQNNWYDILNPRGWTENDAEVAKILIYQRANFSKLEKLYNQVYTNSRNLKNDIIALLDSAELKKVRKYLKI